MFIKSKTNDKIKEVKELSKSAQSRREKSLFVCDGLRLCADAVSSGSEIVNVFYTDSFLQKHEKDAISVISAAKNSYEIDGSLMNYVSDTVSPQGIICVVKAKEKPLTLEKMKKYIALDDIQSPDNLGAVMRTAEALGIDGLIICGGCDIYNPKAVRASMGAVFRLPILKVKDLSGYINECKDKGIYTYASVPEKDASDISEVDFRDGGICVIGNEGNGITADVIDACKEKVTILMKGRAESLNAAAAASIIMWEMTR